MKVLGGILCLVVLVHGVLVIWRGEVYLDPNSWFASDDADPNDSWGFIIKLNGVAAILYGAAQISIAVYIFSRCVG
ncbi:MAG TPA: hypothetical protein DCZ69_16535 [Syntrophobacteraceae bacterium]|nr:hypothetical protein [Syntrophobacteraceae bacterium]HBZ54004.1 hypothetical protein [Syntrophobacteraceae bacterium]